MTETKRPDISADVYKNILTFTFGDGHELQLDADTLSPAIREQALMHGLKQKIADAAAMSRNSATGASATLEDKRQAMQKVLERLTAGEWNSARGEGGGASLLVRALMQYAGKPRHVVEEQLATWSKKEQAALRRVPEVARIIADLQAAQPVDGVDTSALLAKFTD